MSWSVYAMGTKEAVKAKVAADLDACAKNYAGKEEEKDVLMAKERTLSAIDELGLGPTPYNKTPGVSVKANGSRSTYSCSINVDLMVISLEL